MAVTEEPTQVDERPDLTPAPDRTVRRSEWALVLLGVLAAAVLAFVALRPGADPAVGNHGLIIENGSITAVDHAAEVERGGGSGGGGTGNHGLIIENGSITAVDHAAEVARGGLPGGGATRNHGLIIENGSITSVDHAAEVARQWLRPHRR